MTNKIAGIKFETNTLTTLAQVGADTEESVLADIDALRSGAHTRESLLAHCLDGVESVALTRDWTDYVNTIAAHV